MKNLYLVEGVGFYLVKGVGFYLVKGFIHYPGEIVSGVYSLFNFNAGMFSVCAHFSNLGHSPAA